MCTILDNKELWRRKMSQVWRESWKLWSKRSENDVKICSPKYQLKALVGICIFASSWWNHLSKPIKSWRVIKLACQWEKMSSICYHFVFHVYVVVIQLMLRSMWIVMLLLQAPYKKDTWMISPASPRCSLCGIYACMEEIELDLP